MKAVPLWRQEAGPAERVDAYSETEFAGRDIRAVAQMLSKLTAAVRACRAHDLHKMKPAKSPAWVGEEFMKSQSYPRRY